MENISKTSQRLVEKLKMSTKIIQACCVLHNFVRERDGFDFEDTLIVMGVDDIPDLQNERGIKPGNDIRKAFCDYFLTYEE